MSSEKDIATPMSRKDVLNAIEHNGGRAAELNLSGKTFEPGIDLSHMDLEEIILNDTVFLRRHDEGGFRIYEGANFEGSNLRGAWFERSNLRSANFKDTNLVFAQFNQANLMGAALQGACLLSASLIRTLLYQADISVDTRLEETCWGDRILGEELSDDWYWDADTTYRKLKNWYTEKGMYDVSGKFYYREMEARRKACGRDRKAPALRYLLRSRQFRAFCIALLPADGLYGLWLTVMRILCGYGEKPLRVIISAVTVIIAMALVYSFFEAITPNIFFNNLYYSAVSFTAVGYGSWVSEPTGCVKWLGVIEAIIGVFMMALFLVTFVRRMSR